jgi:hypothetical protein
VTTLRTVDPERVDLTAFVPDTGGGTCHDPVGVVADEDADLLLFAHSDDGGGGGREFVLEQGKITRIGFVLDDEALCATHGSRLCQFLLPGHP